MSKRRFGDRPMPEPDFSEAYDPPLHRLTREELSIVRRRDRDRPWISGNSTVPYTRLRRQEATISERRHR